MDIIRNYSAGVNLGGWISQYRKFDHHHFKTFITEKDIEQIASWGMDHVRLPIDYPVLEDDSRPGVYKEEGFAYIDDCIEWCEKNGLNIILDIHKAPGYSFGSLESNTLFDHLEMQKRFIDLWQALAKRYLEKRDHILFELLNEVVEPTSERWNKLAGRIVAAIRAIDPERYIIIGGNNYNAVTELKNLEILDDQRIIYNFHFYEPLCFTHQKATWVEPLRLLNREQSYPGKCVGIKEFAATHPQYALMPALADEAMDREFLSQKLQPAIDFMRQTGKPLYCGEYGAIDLAPLTSRINWHRDLVDLFRQVGISRACWSYKLMNFGLVDENGKVVSEELVRIVSQK